MVVCSPGRLRDHRRRARASRVRALGWRSYRDHAVRHSLRLTRVLGTGCPGHLWGFGTYPMGAPSGEPSIFPELAYRHDPDAVAWLARAFGFQPAVQIPGPDDRPLHVEMRHGDSTVMLNLGDGQTAEDVLTQAISVRVDDPDALFAGATKEGATVVQAPTATHYGARSCWLRDPERFLWGFTTYRPKV